MPRHEYLYGQTLPQLEALCNRLEMPRFAAKQIARWLYDKHATTIEAMSDLSARHRALLAETYEVGLTAPEKVSISTDGTKKYLYRTSQNHFIESAYIPDGDRATLCISSQAGCRMGCRFCATKPGRPLAPDAEEPRQVAESVALMKLRYVVVTSVTRDDLPDGGAAHWAATVEAIRTQNPDAVIELLIPDLDARPDLLEVIVASKPDIIGHNIETVERLTPVVRSRAKYRTSLETLRCLNRQGVVTKSGLMVGLGESDDEVLQTLHDLRDAGVRIVTLGQYLRPTLEHYPVAAYITPEKFEWYRLRALEMGFSYCASAPLVRSSYMAEEALRSVKSL